MVERINAVQVAAASQVVETPPLADSLLNFVARAMADPTIDVAKLEVLLRIQREIVADDARLRFNRAMSAAQAEMLPVVRNASNNVTNSKYATLEAVDAVIRPIYTRHGFLMTFNSEPIDGADLRVVCEVSHDGGHLKRYELEASPDTVGTRGNVNKTALHALGSTVTYLRRYLTMMCWNLVTTDDQDGNRPTQQNDGEIVGQGPVDELYALLDDCSAVPSAREANERTFLGKMGLGAVRSMKDIRTADVPRLRNALLTKRAVISKQRAERAVNGHAL